MERKIIKWHSFYQYRECQGDDEIVERSKYMLIQNCQNALILFFQWVVGDG